MFLPEFRKSHGSEPEENFAFYVVFEEGLVIGTNKPVSAKLSVHRASAVKGIALIQWKIPRNAQCIIQELRPLLIALKEKVYAENLTAERLELFLDSGVCYMRKK